MKNVFAYLLSFVLLLIIGCSSDDDKSDLQEPVNENIKTRIVNSNGVPHKIYYQEANQPTTRRGLIILAVGDGGNENDATLNNQCNALAQKGYVAITTTYRSNPGNTYTAWMVSLKQDFEAIIQDRTAEFGINRNKVVIGGLSRGGNLTLGMVTPGQMGNEAPIQGIKGVILECAGGDWWKGSAILFPTLLMSNATDNVVGTNAEDFKTGLQNNANTEVKTKSKTLIIPGEGHCTNSNQYKDFIVNNIDNWFQ